MCHTNKSEMGKSKRNSHTRRVQREGEKKDTWPILFVDDYDDDKDTFIYLLLVANIQTAALVTLILLSCTFGMLVLYNFSWIRPVVCFPCDFPSSRLFTQVLISLLFQPCLDSFAMHSTQFGWHFSFRFGEVECVCVYFIMSCIVLHVRYQTNSIIKNFNGLELCRPETYRAFNIHAPYRHIMWVSEWVCIVFGVTVCTVRCSLMHIMWQMCSNLLLY